MNTEDVIVYRDLNIVKRQHIERWANVYKTPSGDFFLGCQLHESEQDAREYCKLLKLNPCKVIKMSGEILLEEDK